MSRNSVLAAAEFVASIQLPESLPPELEAADVPPQPLTQGHDQALIVGSDIVSFVAGVTPEQRQDIVNSSLLAQLAAKKTISDPSDIEGWYDRYFDVLSNIGWVIQERDFATYSTSAQGFEAHNVIEELATALLAPNLAAIAVIKKVLEALRGMERDSPWITLFDRESKSAKNARFQVTLAEQTRDNQFLVSLMAFRLAAQSNLTQVLFFRFRTSEAELRHYTGKVAIAQDVLSGIREDIKLKIGRHAKDYVRALPEF
jgi:hypothetical protein